MKTYIKPAVEVHNVAPNSIIAESFKINTDPDNKTTEQLVREDGWDDMWSETAE